MDTGAHLYYHTLNMQKVRNSRLGSCLDACQNTTNNGQPEQCRTVFILVELYTWLFRATQLYPLDSDGVRMTQYFIYLSQYCIFISLPFNLLIKSLGKQKQKVVDVCVSPPPPKYLRFQDKVCVVAHSDQVGVKIHECCKGITNGFILCGPKHVHNSLIVAAC